MDVETLKIILAVLSVISVATLIGLIVTIFHYVALRGQLAELLHDTIHQKKKNNKKNRVL